MTTFYLPVSDYDAWKTESPYDEGYIYCDGDVEDDDCNEEEEYDEENF